jgi:hypothetical protein
MSIIIIVIYHWNKTSWIDCILTIISFFVILNIHNYPLMFCVCSFCKVTMQWNNILWWTLGCGGTMAKMFKQSHLSEGWSHAINYPTFQKCATSCTRHKAIIHFSGVVFFTILSHAQKHVVDHSTLIQWTSKTGHIRIQDRNRNKDTFNRRGFQHSGEEITCDAIVQWHLSHLSGSFGGEAFSSTVR